MPKLQLLDKSQKTKTLLYKGTSIENHLKFLVSISLVLKSIDSVRFWEVVLIAKKHYLVAKPVLRIS